MPSKYLEALSKPGQGVNPLFGFLGVVPVHVDASRAVLELPLRPEFIQGAGVVAGGVLATLADEAMAHLVLANLAEGERTATIEMSVRYFRPVLGAGALRAEASLVSRGRRIVGVEAGVTDSEGRLAAKASASFFILEAKPA